MKKLILFSILCLAFTSAGMAQEPAICGTWIYHYPGYYVDGEEIWPKCDEYLKIDEKDGTWFVSIKRGKDGEFYGYSEATQVVCNDDDSLSFNELYDNKVRHDDGTTSHVYNSYRAWLVGRTLHVKPLRIGLWYDRAGNLYSNSATEKKPDAICVYHNEKDNW